MVGSVIKVNHFTLLVLPSIRSEVKTFGTIKILSGFSSKIAHYQEGSISNRGLMEKSWCWRLKSRFSDCVQPAIFLPLYSRLFRWPRTSLTQPPDQEGVGTAISWYARKRLNQTLIRFEIEVFHWAEAQARRLDQSLIELFVNSVDEDNNNVEFLSVNETIMTASCYNNSKSIMTAAPYDSGTVDACLATRLVSQ